VILATGSTAGLGAAMAERLAREGANIVITGRSADRGTAMQHKQEELGAPALFVTMDVADEDQVKAAVGAAEERFGKLTGLINNAAWIQNRN
jgi:NAD(P)-dependent dehydrogenase (short-subunit alcohol dehydrogenase family)